MDHTRSLQDMVNNGLDVGPGMEWLGPQYDNRHPVGGEMEWSDPSYQPFEVVQHMFLTGGANPQYDNNMRAYRKRHHKGDDNDSTAPPGGEVPMVPALNLMPTHCGWLLKKRKPGGIKSNLAPQRRWCCLKQGVFYYYTTDLSDKQQGSFLLDGYNADQMTVKKSALWIRLHRPGYRTYEFQAGDEGDLQRWLDALARETTQTQGGSTTALAKRTLPPLPGQALLPGQMLPPLDPLPNNQHRFEPEPDMYDDTDIPPTGTDDESSDSYDDVDPGGGPQFVPPGGAPPFVPPRPAPLSEVRGPPQLPMRPGKEGREQGNISKLPPRRDQPDVPKGPALPPGRPRPGGKTTPPVVPDTQRPPTPPSRPGRTRVVSDIYEPVQAPPEGNSDSDTDSYDDAISEIVNPHLNKFRKAADSYDDSGFSSQASDWSNTSFRSVGDGPSVPPTKKPLPPKPSNTSSRPPQPIPNTPQFDLQSQLRKKLQNQTQANPSHGKPKPTFYKKLYVAQFDYTSDRPDELDLKRGDLIKIIDKQYDRQRWWTGSKEGKTGLVPKTYLTEVYQP